MLRVTDAATLAFTKLRTRKVRLIVTIVVSGLLFSGLAAASMIARGAFASLEDFSKEGFGSRYILSAYSHDTSGNIYENKEVIDRATAIHKDMVARKKAEAKRLELQYDERSEQPPVTDYDGPTGKVKQLNFTSPSAQKALQEYFVQHPVAGLAQLKKLSAPYSPVGFYESKYMAFGAPGMPTLKILKDGAESFDENANQGNPNAQGIDTFTSSWTLASNDLLEPFLVPGTTLTLGKDGSIPIVAPYSAVEQLLKLKTLPANASTEEKLKRIQEVREGAKKVTFQVCYRNTTSMDVISSALAAKREQEQNKNNKEYQKPSLIYSLPGRACEAAPVTRDVRTYDEKVFAGRQAEFDKTFGKEDAEQTILTFRVIGIAPDPFSQNASGIAQLLGGLVGSSLGETGWYTPLDIRDKVPQVGKVFPTNTASVQGRPDALFVELPSADQARAFIEQKNCDPDFGKIDAGNMDENPFVECTKEGKPFSISPFGSNSLALESVAKWFGKVFTIAALVVAAIASIIMMGTVGRAIADSRRETAVFRAIGAKKIDVTQIYALYAMSLSVLIAVFAIIGGGLIASLVHGKYHEEFTTQAIITYNAKDLSREFALFAFYGRDMLYLIGLAIAGGVVSAIFPLLRNLRRNPIRDMRDEN